MLSSSDFITVLIGQNESGKTSILSALEAIFGSEEITDDDIRADADLPTVSIRLQTSFEEIASQLETAIPSDQVYLEEQLEALRLYLQKAKGTIEYSVGWSKKLEKGKAIFSSIRAINDDSLSKRLADSWTPPEQSDSASDEHESTEDGEFEEQHSTTIATIKELQCTDVAEAIYYAAPYTVLFDEKSGLLPDRIDILIKQDEPPELSGEGATAAKNYLEIAGINLNSLVIGDARLRATMLHRGNEKVTSDFATFWSQTIGKKDKLYLKCDLQFYDSNTPSKIGKPYLSFWISDGQNHLYPKQRSTGVRWFLSFYLQLIASDLTGTGTFFLLDEPGANLHSKAQQDVLNLINQLNDEKKLIMYSTHSPHMVEYDKLFRVLAIQREGDLDDTPTVVVHAHRLGGASRDTLSPILMAMGADLSQQEVIKKRDNVILEEMSGFYYLKSFWKLTGERTEAHFIAATGANNVETLANMFVGWGLDFIVAVDDDQTGRSVFNSIKRNMFGDNEDAAKERLLKIDGKGIEDIFDRSDFKTLVLNDPDAEFDCENSQYVKDVRLSKTLLAYQFWINVSQEMIKLKKFTPQTRSAIQGLTKSITSRLESRT
ncbi:MAG: AAA family ATPase [Afipia sp.]